MRNFKKSSQLQNDRFNNLITFSSKSNHVIVHQFQHIVDRDFLNCWLVLHPKGNTHTHNVKDKGEGKTEICEYCNLKYREERVGGRETIPISIPSHLKAKEGKYENPRKGR